MIRIFGLALLRITSAGFVFLTLSEVSFAQSCTPTLSTMAFGAYNPLGGGSVSTSTAFSINCTGSPNQTITFCIRQTGANCNQMSSGSNVLAAAAYEDSGHTVPISCGTNYSFSVPLASNGVGISGFTLYGLIATGQSNAVPGSYSSGTTVSGNYAYGSNLSCTGTTTSFPFNFSATVLAGCIVSTSALNFGSTSSFIIANKNATATLTAQCTSTTPYSIGLDNGQNASGSQRRMSMGGGNYVSYGLYTDTGYSQAWTPTSSTTSCTGGASTCVLGTGTGSNQSITVYGQVSPQTAPVIGTYTDTVVVTLTF
jgi:spore coat protein U-like protein